MPKFTKIQGFVVFAKVTYYSKILNKIFMVNFMDYWIILTFLGAGCMVHHQIIMSSQDFTDKFQIQFIKNWHLRFFQEWVHLKAYYMYFQEHIGFICDPQSIFCIFWASKARNNRTFGKHFGKFLRFFPLLTQFIGLHVKFYTIRMLFLLFLQM